MSREGLKNNSRKDSERLVSVSYGKETMSKLTRFLSEIIKDTKLNKESKGNFLKSERKDK